MKRAVCLIVFAPILAAAQGNYVVFENIVLAPPPDRLVRFTDGSPMVGTNFMAQLLVGLTPNSLQPTTAAPAQFRDPGTTVPGTWRGNTINLPGFTPGMVLTMQVRIWDSNYGDFDQACLFNQAGLLPTFDWTVPGESEPVDAHYMLNFVGGIPTPCPEPGIWALALVGLAVALLLRGRRTSSRR